MGAGCMPLKSPSSMCAACFPRSRTASRARKSAHVCVFAHLVVRGAEGGHRRGGPREAPRAGVVGGRPALPRVRQIPGRTARLLAPHLGGDQPRGRRGRVDGCVEINQCVGARSHCAAMTWPSWLDRTARNRHRHAIGQASRRWRGGRRDDSTRSISDFHTGSYARRN